LGTPYFAKASYGYPAFTFSSRSCKRSKGFGGQAPSS